MAAATNRLGAMTATIPGPAASPARRRAADEEAAALVRLATLSTSTTRKTAWMMRVGALIARRVPPPRRGGHAAVPPSTEEDIDDDFVPSQLGIKDIISLWITQILQTYGDEESKDGAPVCEGSVDDLVGGPIFLALYPYFLRYGGVFKLAFGPKVFMVLSDPVVVREVLKEKPFAFSKGVLAEILEPIMGQGLIRPRTRCGRTGAEVVPGFHKAWLDHMVGLFGDCSTQLVKNLDAEIAAKRIRVATWRKLLRRPPTSSASRCSTTPSDQPRGSHRSSRRCTQCLQEAAHRSTFYFPTYWNLPLADVLGPRQREFKNNMNLINETLNGLIKKAQAFEGTEDFEELQNRDYSKVKDASLLRFLVDIRGADVTDSQLRDDLHDDAHRGSRDDRGCADLVPVLPRAGPRVDGEGGGGDRRRHGAGRGYADGSELRADSEDGAGRRAWRRRFGCSPSPPSSSGDVWKTSRFPRARATRT